MYIEPNTSIIILKNCPLDTTYEHTIYFESKSAQVEYFKGLKKYTLERNTYQRVKRGYMRVNIQAENLYDCNYLMFQNTAFGSKWFYAFIESVEYINNAVSEIEFKIDVMQTWFFDYKLQECFVEREHSATDVVGENIVEEKLDTGEYICVNTQKYLDGKDNSTMYLYILSTFEAEYNNGSPLEALPATKGVWHLLNERPVYSGLNCWGLSLNEPEAIFQWIDIINEKGKIDGIVSAYYSPVRGILDTKINLNSDPYALIGYEPKNQKLKTYPYTFIYVSNYNGNSAVYRNEFFRNYHTKEFKLMVDSYPNSIPVLTPLAYKGVDVNTDESITGKPYPQVAFNNDVYKQWLARSSTQFAGKLINSVTGGLSSATNATAYGGNVGASFVGGIVGSSLGAVTSTLSQGLEAKIMPSQSQGNPQSISEYVNGRLGFFTCNKVITKKYAEIIDNYFDRYGYATHLNKVPNRNVRPHWCYTKTIGCTIKGSVPCDDMKTICSIFDNGITFWKDGNNIGNYSLDNRV